MEAEALSAGALSANRSVRELFISEWAAGSQWGSSTELLLEIRRKCERNEAHAAVLAPLRRLRWALCSLSPSSAAFCLPVDLLEEVAGCVAAAVRPEVRGRWCEPLRAEEGGWGGDSGGVSGGGAAGADDLLAWVDAQGGDD